jgi:hypothetical protein
MPQSAAPIPGGLAASYRHNLVRLQYRRRLVELRPTDGPSAAVDEVLYIHSVWNPYGRPSSLAENRGWAASEDLALEGEALDAAILLPDRRIVERAVALRQTNRQFAGIGAARFGQPALFRWDSSGLAVLRSDTYERVDGWAVEVVPVDQRPCVMEPERAEGRCRQGGGPWTSGSIRAALNWRHDFETRMAALGGCDACGGQPDAEGGPIGLVVLSVRSRWTPDLTNLGPS